MSHPSPALDLPRRTATMAVALLAAGFTTACGTQDHDRIPPELLAALSGPGSTPYPGPYGNQIGDIATNVCVQAWDNPKAQGYAEAALERRCLGDFYDPTGEEHQLLLVNTAAVWCLACRSEYAGSSSQPSLQQHVEARWDDGFRILGVMFQDERGDPARFEDAAAWAEVFDVEFAFALDSTLAMAEFADSNVQPLNMLIDTRTMEIIQQIDGDAPATFWPLVDERLGRDAE